jgi:hypothetical protein
MSVVALAQGAQAQKEANFVPASPDQIRNGTANGVGGGQKNGDVKISAVFTPPRPLNLAARGARVTVRNGLNEIVGAGELVLQGPLTLVADSRNTSETARFESAAGSTPPATATIGSLGRGQYSFSLAMSQATIALPAGCPKPSLATSIEVHDGTNPVVVVNFQQPWTCVNKNQEVYYLTLP